MAEDLQEENRRLRELLSLYRENRDLRDEVDRLKLVVKRLKFSVTKSQNDFEEVRSELKERDSKFAQIFELVEINNEPRR